VLIKTQLAGYLLTDIPHSGLAQDAQRSKRGAIISVQTRREIALLSVFSEFIEIMDYG
jgi:hypothetical protein